MNPLRLRIIVPFLALLVVPGSAWADDGDDSIVETLADATAVEVEDVHAIDARVYHNPKPTVKAGDDLPITARVEGDWTLAEVRLVARPTSATAGANRESFDLGCGQLDRANLTAQGTCVIQLARDSAGEFSATIPTVMLNPPGIAYHLESVSDAGEVVDHFATDEAPWEVGVSGETDATERQRKLARHRGNTSRFELSGDVNLFGATILDQGSRETDAFSDLFASGELSYTYRTLGILYAFQFGVGIMRGQRARVDGVAGVVDADGRPLDEPGFNWGWGAIDLEIHRNFSLAAKVILGASEDGFSGGLGTVMRVGPSFATHFHTGVDWIADLGPRVWMGFIWDTVPTVPMGLKVEYTSWPDSDDTDGVRLLYHATWEINRHVEVGATIGYVNRLQALGGGVAAGLNTAVEF